MQEVQEVQVQVVQEVQVVLCRHLACGEVQVQVEDLLGPGLACEGVGGRQLGELHQPQLHLGSRIVGCGW